MMTFWNFLCDSFITIKEKCLNLYNYITDYYYGYNSTWIFIDGHTMPITLNNIYNNIYADWIYDNYDNSLSNYTNLNKNTYPYSFSWLSAKIVIINSLSSTKIEHNIDNFIENFRLVTYDNIVPSLYIIYMCWCASKKHWYSLDNIIEFHIIDNMGDEVIFNLKDHNHLICIQQKKIHITIDIIDESEFVIDNLDKTVEKESLLIEENENKYN